MKILLAIDDSKYSEAAIRQLIAQASPQTVEVRLLHVIEPEVVYPDGQSWGLASMGRVVTPEQRKAAEGIVARAARTIRDAGFSITTSIETGDPRVLILDAANEWKADLILVGSHGRKGLDRFLLGSVSESVARNAHCSVEIARTAAG